MAGLSALVPILLAGSVYLSTRVGDQYPISTFVELDKEASCILNNGTCLNDLDHVGSLDPVGAVVGR